MRFAKAGLVILICGALGACATKPAKEGPLLAGHLARADMADTTSRQQFLERFVFIDPEDPAYFDSVEPKMRACLAREFGKDMPDKFNSAIDQFVTTKSAADWDKLIAVHDSTRLDNYMQIIEENTKLCDSEVGS